MHLPGAWGWSWRGATRTSQSVGDSAHNTTPNEERCQSFPRNHWILSPFYPKLCHPCTTINWLDEEEHTRQNTVEPREWGSLSQGEESNDLEYCHGESGLFSTNYTADRLFKNRNWRSIKLEKGLPNRLLQSEITGLKENIFNCGTRVPCNSVRNQSIWDIFIIGKPFILQTDHRALQWLQKSKDKNTRLLRWSLMLQPYIFTIQHHQGLQNGNADALSRLPVDSPRFTLKKGGGGMLQI